MFPRIVMLLFAVFLVKFSLFSLGSVSVCKACLEKKGKEGMH